MAQHEIRVMRRSSFLQHNPNKNYGAHYQIFDLTSQGPAPFVALSSFYPHGNIAVPGKPAGTVGQSMEGIWQGLKLFRTQEGAPIGVDASKWQLQDLEQIRRRVRRRPPTSGTIVGHSWNGADGLQEESQLDLADARLRIYLPAYEAAIHSSVEAQQALRLLAAAARRGPVMLLDYHTNPDPMAPPKLSPVAAVVKPLLLGMLAGPPLPPAEPQAEVPAPPAQPQADLSPPVYLPEGDGFETATDSETESEERSTQYDSAAPSLATN